MVTSIRNGLAARAAAHIAALASSVDQLDDVECLTDADARLVFNVRHSMTTALASMSDPYRELGLIRDHAALVTFNPSDHRRLYERLNGLFLDVGA